MKNNKKGFTLIELIVVIAILGVLMMLVVPSVTGYLNSSKKAVANGNAKTCYNTYMSAQTMIDTGLETGTLDAVAKPLGLDAKCGVIFADGKTEVKSVSDIAGAYWDGTLTEHAGEYKPQ